jgi:hypothetical protein
VIAHIRADAQRSGSMPLTDTYGLALSVLFLDRLGDEKDQEAMRRLALRLVAGQNQAGGWTYSCPSLAAAEERRLLAFLEAAAPREGTPPAAEALRERAQALPEALRSLPVVRFLLGEKFAADGGDDNSNTQFAVLAVWAAQKHGVPVNGTLALVDARFHSTQNDDGSWGYSRGQSDRADSMTCAGLLGLAAGRGRHTAEDGELRGKDAAIARGLAFLSRSIGRTGQVNQGDCGRFFGAASWGDLYYLWSLERVAVIYDLPKIGGKDWYGWGAKVLVDGQESDGSWAVRFEGVPDTCFALLFLKRINVAQDLSDRLRSLGGLIEGGEYQRRPDR